MFKRLSVWMLVVVLWPVLLRGENPQSVQVTSQTVQLGAALVDGSAAEQQPENGGFEMGKVGMQPAGWKVPDIPGYRVTTTNAQPATGSQCAAIISIEGPERGPFGNLLQGVDARPFRGHQVRFRGAIRTEVSGQGNQAQMWLRVDRRAEDGTRKRGAFDNMSNRPITSSEWNHYEIVANVDVDADYIVLGVLLRGEGKAWADDMSLEIVDAEIPATARRFGRTGGTSFDELKPGLYEVVASERLSTLEPQELDAIREAGHDVTGLESPREVSLLMPLPLAYRDQVPLNFRLTVTPREAVQSLEIYEDQPGNHVLKLVVADVPTWKAVDVRYTSTLLVGPTWFDAVPAAAPLPETWPDEATPWLAATWCANADHERIRALAGEIRAETDDVLQIIRRVQAETSSIFRSAEGQLENLTAVEALDKVGSCTSCANLVAALLRACDVPARILAGYPPWYGPLQTHYIVEAYVPEFGWYPIEASMSRSPWPNTHEIHVAIIPPEYEQQEKAGVRNTAFGGVPYLSLTELPGETGIIVVRPMIDESRRLDHQARKVRALTGTPDQWQQAIADARVRWRNWLAGSHDLDANGQIQFGKRADDISATSASAVVAELDQ